MPVKKENNGDILGKQMVVKDLLTYQEGAVVSRTLIDKKGGTVTIFSFDEGQGLSEHTAPFDAMVQIIEGEARITIEGQPYHIMEGEIIILPASKPHAVRAVTRFKMMLTMIRWEDHAPEPTGPPVP